MANATVNRTGQVNQAGDVDALFLKVYAGEVLTAFERSTITLDKHMVRTIANGKSAAFPVTGKIGAEYHVPGAELTGLQGNQAERIITIDDLLVSHVFLADIDEAKTHFDVRSIYSTEMGRKLAQSMDIAVFQEHVLAARAAAAITGGNGGTELVNDLFKNDGGTAGAATEAAKAAALAIGVFQIAQTFDEKDIPEDQRFVCFRPAEYYCLVQNKDVLNQDWGGRGSYAEGDVIKIAGVTILKSNNVPKTDTSVADTRHGVDASKTVGIGWTPRAVGTTKLMDLSMQSEYDVRRQGTLLVARYAMGHGIIDPSCAVELKLGTLSN